MPALAQNPSEGRRLTPEEYIKANYEPQDHLAVLIHHRAKGDTIQRVNTAEAHSLPPNGRAGSATSMRMATMCIFPRIP